MSKLDLLDLQEDCMISNNNPNSEADWNGIDELDREDDYTYRE